ncbi:MAG: glycosyltransferase [Candidatus Omnitrophica bacterium]|nr:glycosyltransferase [Candidatus Omnitrophota bacterium]
MQISKNGSQYDSGISVVIPAFRAERHIGDTMRKIRATFGSGPKIIVVVNDPLSDTLSIIKNIAREDPGVSYLYFKQRLGKGIALQEGFKAARTSIIGFVDADAPFPLDLIKDKLTLLDNDSCDCLIFSKWKGNSFGNVRQKFFRKCLSRVFNYIVKVLFKLEFSDTQGGAKFLKKDVFDRLGGDFLCAGFLFDLELILKLRQQDMRIKELPIFMSGNSSSTVSITKDSWAMGKELYKLIRYFLVWARKGKK